MASTATAATFYPEFARLKADVLAALDTDAGGAAGRLAALRTALAGVRAELPAYDQRSYDLQIKELETRLAAGRVDKKSRFAFKCAPKSGSTSASASGTSTPTVPAPALGPASALASAPAPSAPGPPTYTLASRADSTLTERDLSPEGTYTLTLRDLTRCVVDLRPLGDARLTSLHASGLTECVVLAPRMAGSAMLSDMSRCVVAVGAQQFRLHTTRDTVVCLDVPSLPVIEGSQGVCVMGYPAALGGNEGESKFAQVQDFDWVRGGPSPNWRVASAEEEGTVDEAIKKVLNGASGDVLQNIPCIQRCTN